MSESKKGPNVADVRTTQGVHSIAESRLVADGLHVNLNFTLYLEDGRAIGTSQE